MNLYLLLFWQVVIVYELFLLIFEKIVIVYGVEIFSFLKKYDFLFVWDMLWRIRRKV
jgi:hypothetical protein